MLDMAVNMSLNCMMKVSYQCLVTYM